MWERISTIGEPAVYEMLDWTYFHFVASVIVGITSFVFFIFKWKYDSVNRTIIRTLMVNIICKNDIFKDKQYISSLKTGDTLPKVDVMLCWCPLRHGFMKASLIEVLGQIVADLLSRFLSCICPQIWQLTTSSHLVLLPSYLPPILCNSYYKHTPHFKHSNPVIPLLQQKQQPHKKHCSCMWASRTGIPEPKCTGKVVKSKGGQQAQWVAHKTNQLFYLKTNTVSVPVLCFRMSAPRFLMIHPWPCTVEQRQPVPLEGMQKQHRNVCAFVSLRKFHQNLISAKAKPWN